MCSLDRRRCKIYSIRGEVKPGQNRGILQGPPPAGRGIDISRYLDSTLAEIMPGIEFHEGGKLGARSLKVSSFILGFQFLPPPTPGPFKP